MTVAQLLEELEKMPKEAVVLMESGGGLSLVSAMDFVEAGGPGAPAEVILLPNMDEQSIRDDRKRMMEADVKMSMFERIGGAIAVDRLVETFYDRMDRDPAARTVRAMHAPDLSETKQVLKRYLCEWMGGPKLYSTEKGHPRLRRRHMGFSIGMAERDAWLLCMRDALDRVVADGDARREIFEALEKLADWMRNQADNPHDAGRARP